MVKLRSLSGSDRHGKLVERDGQPPVRRLPGGQLVVSPPNVLDEGMTNNDHPGVSYRRNQWMSPWHENAAYLPP